MKSGVLAIRSLVMCIMTSCLSAGESSLSICCSSKYFRVNHCRSKCDSTRDRILCGSDRCTDESPTMFT